MAWMFTKSQTGYLDEYWGLDSSGNCWGIRNFICVYQIIALTHLTPFYQMQRPFREKKHSALGNPFSVEVSFHVSA